jgi:hypothetical protein
LYLSKVNFKAFRRHLLYIDGLRSAAKRFDASWNKCTLSKSKILIEKKKIEEIRNEEFGNIYKPFIDQRVCVKPFRDHLA